MRVGRGGGPPVRAPPGPALSPSSGLEPPGEWPQPPPREQPPRDLPFPSLRARTVGVCWATPEGSRPLSASTHFSYR